MAELYDASGEEAEQIKERARSHDWVASSLGHGFVMCRHCRITDREAAALGVLNHCEKADAQSQ